MNIDFDRQVIAFLHAYKTGGTTMTNLLRSDHIILENQFLELNLNRCRESWFRANEQVLERARLISGSFLWHFELQRFLDRSCLFFTMLRDPIERVISQYYHELRHCMTEDSIEVWLMRHSSLNIYSQLYGGGAGEPGRAIETLDKYFYWVGITDRFEESVYLLRNATDVEHRLITSYNVNKSKKSKREIPEHLISEIQEKTSLDLEIYQYALTRHESNLSNLDQCMREEMHRFYFSSVLKPDSGSEGIVYKYFEWLSKHRGTRFVLFGAGAFGKSLIDQCERFATKHFEQFPEYFLDNSPEKFGELYKGLDIRSPKEGDRDSYVILCCNARETVTEQLVELGYDRNRIISLW